MFTETQSKKVKKNKKHRHNAAGGWYAVSVLHTGQYICSPEPGGGGGCWLVDLVLMLEQKTMRKGAFFQAGQCAALSSFRIRKTAF